MRRPALSLMTALTLAIAVPATAIAVDLPRRKSGLWEISTATQQGQPMSAQMCVDQKTDDLTRQLAGIGVTCSKQNVRRESATRYVIDSVKPKRTKFSLEMVPWLVTGTPENYLRLIEAVDRPAFAAHIDAANMIVSPSLYFDTPGMLRHGFELLGPYVVSAHAKDIVMQGGPGRISFHMDEVAIGAGNLDYRAYLRELNGLGRDVPRLGREIDARVEKLRGELPVGVEISTVADQPGVVRRSATEFNRSLAEAVAIVLAVSFLSLGLRTGPTLKLVVIPQAMRVIIPPLTSQYLNLTKNSSLAVFVGYPDLVQVFTGTVLNQTGQAVEVVMITMAVYLSISLVTSMVMNWYNARIALVER